MNSISRFASTIHTGATLGTANALPPLTPPKGGGVDPLYRAIKPDLPGSFEHEAVASNLTTSPLPSLDALTRWKAKFDHFVNGPAFPEYKDGFMSGRLIEGSAGHDDIQVRFDPATGGAFVTRWTSTIDPDGPRYPNSPKVTSYLTAEEAKSLRIVGGGGDDRIEVDRNFPYPVHLIGGEGNDYLVGGKGNDLIEAGTGSDVVYGNAGVDHVSIDRDGYDRLYLGTDQDPNSGLR